MTTIRVPEAVRWSPDGDAVRIIDQRRLPDEYVERDLVTLDDVCDAIRTLAVRGAPAIGIAGAMGLAVVASHADAQCHEELLGHVTHAAKMIRATRPTAVNLPWAIDRMLARIDDVYGVDAIRAALHDEATRILDDDRAMCRRIGEHALSLFPESPTVITHCNAGALATGGIGTALAPIYLAKEQGRDVHVFADETRPLLQGSRLTAWELARAGVPVTVLADGMAASLMRERSISCCIVGADRIAANGDVANKIGTYALAIVAHHHGVPFYVAAPSSTIDARVASGAEIDIEQRDANELRSLGSVRTAPDDAAIYNPAFDVTPHALISAIITDRGVHRAPFDFSRRS